jgi:hypothetical protein
MNDIDSYPIPLPADFLEPLVPKKEPLVPKKEPLVPKKEPLVPKVKGGSRMSHFSYNSTQTHSSYVDGKLSEVTESTKIHNGKGSKTVKKRNGRQVSTKTLPLTSSEIKNIQTKKFMPSLFADCHNGLCDNKKSFPKTRKVSRRTKKSTK